MASAEREPITGVLGAEPFIRRAKFTGSSSVSRTTSGKSEVDMSTPVRAVARNFIWGRGFNMGAD